MKRELRAPEAGLFTGRPQTPAAGRSISILAQGWAEPGRNGTDKGAEMARIPSVCWMPRVFVCAAALALGVSGSALAGPLQPSRSGFNWNVPACPQAGQYSSLISTIITSFDDGSPLPSCGGMQNGQPFKMVWTGTVWAKVMDTSINGLSGGSGPAVRPDVNLSSLTLGRSGNGQAIYQYNGKWYQVSQVVAQGAGNIVAHDGGTLIAANGNYIYVLKLITQDGAGIAIPSGANMQSQAHRRR